MLGWESLKDSVRPVRKSRPVLAAVGHLLLGACAGVISLFVFPNRLVPDSRLPGLSLILSPLGNGVIMHAIGTRWDERPEDRPALFSFRAGATFALGMALVRFWWLR